MSINDEHGDNILVPFYYQLPRMKVMGEFPAPRFGDRRRYEQPGVDQDVDWIVLLWADFECVLLAICIHNHGNAKCIKHYSIITKG